MSVNVGTQQTSLGTTILAAAGADKPPVVRVQAWSRTSRRPSAVSLRRDQATRLQET